MYIILTLLPTFLSYFSLPDPEILSSIVILNCPINVRDFCDLHVLSLIQEEISSPRTTYLERHGRSDSRQFQHQRESTFPSWH